MWRSFAVCRARITPIKAWILLARRLSNVSISLACSTNLRDISHINHYTLSDADPKVILPAIPGHESAGVVVDVGPDVPSLKKGDRVCKDFPPVSR